MKRLLRYWLLLATVLVVATSFVACSASGAPTRGPLPTVARSQHPTPTPTPIVIEADDGAVQLKLHMSRNGSQQIGTVTITQVGEFTELVIQLTPAAPVGQPVTLRQGTCEAPTGFVRDLDSVVGGILRQTFTDMPIGRFLRGDITVIVAPGFGSLGAVSACADVPRIERPDLPGFLTPR